MTCLAFLCAWHGVMLARDSVRYFLQDSVKAVQVGVLDRGLLRCFGKKQSFGFSIKGFTVGLAFSYFPPIGPDSLPG